MVCQVWDYTSSCCHKAQHIIKCVVAKWSRAVPPASLAGLNDLHGLCGFWNKLLHSGFRCDRYFSMSFTGQRFEPGLLKILPFDSSSLLSRPPWWFLVANTAPRSLLISKYFSPLGVSLKTSMCFFKSCWFSRPHFPRNRLIKNQAVCWSLCGWSESVSTTFVLQFGTDFLCQRLLVPCWSYLTALAEGFQKIAQRCVCIVKLTVSKNRKWLGKRRTSQVTIQRGSPCGSDFLL